MNKNYLRVLTATLLFGSIGLFVRAIPLASAAIALVRATLGALVLLAAAFLTRRPPRWRVIGRQLLPLALSGAFIGINWILLFEAYRYTTVSAATVAYYAAPVLVVLAAPLVLREPFSAAKLIGVIAAAAGTLLLTGTGEGAGSDPVRGLLLGLGAAVLYAAVILTNKFITGLSGLERTFTQLAFSALTLAPYLLVTRPEPTGRMTAAGLACLVIVGLVHTGFAYLLYFSAMAELPGQTIALLGYIDPVSALIFSAALLGERLSPVQLLGAALVLGGAAFGELWQKKKSA